MNTRTTSRPPRRTPVSHREAPKKVEVRNTVKDGTLRLVPLGGFEEVGRNMMFLEYGDEIIIIDAGLQFAEEETPGVDYIIPNVEYLRDRKDKIKAMIITHGHYDHIGAIPHIMEELGNPVIFTTRISKEIILKRQEDYPNSPKLLFQLVKGGETIQLGQHFSITFFDVVHNIPDGIGMIIRTPVGNVVHPGEFKFDYDLDGKPRGLDVWERVGKEGTHTLLIDSTGAEVPGFSVSERVVEAELEKLFRSAKGRILVGTFASLLDRLGEIIKIAEKLGRRVAISGLSMKTNLQIAQNLGYLKFEKGTIIPLEDIKKYHDDKLLILCTGAQGEPRGGFARIANGEHREIKIHKGDMVVLSSSVIAGNERRVQNLKDNMARQGANVFHNKMLAIHSSGHAPQEELKAVMKLINPKFVVPMHGYYFMRQRNSQLAQEVLGIPPEQTLLGDNGLVIEITKDSAKVTEEQVPANYVTVDGLGVGDVGEIVLRDRVTLSQEGMVVIIAVVSRTGGRLLKNPEIISRGFIYLKDSREMVEQVRHKIRTILSKIPQGQHQTADPDYLKTLLREQIGQFLYTKTHRRPMVLPVLIEV